MKKFFALAFLLVAILISTSSVAFASAPLASKTPFVIDFSDVEFTPEQADFLKAWCNSPYSALVITDSLATTDVFTFYVFQPYTRFVTSSSLDDTLRSLYVNHNGYSRLVFCPSTGEVNFYTKPTYGKIELAVWYSGNKSRSSKVVSGSCFASPSFSAPANFQYFKYFSEIAFVGDDDDIFDGFVSPFPVLPSVSVKYKYADGSRAFPTYVEKFSVGSGYSIPSPTINGHVADTVVVSGSNLTASVVRDVVYHKACDILVTYQYEDGSQAFPPFNQTFYEGDSYNIVSPPLSGYVPSISLIVGTVSNDTELSMSYNVVYAKGNAIVSSGDFVSFLDTLINFLGIVTLIGCTIFACFLSVRLVVKIIGFFV